MKDADEYLAYIKALIVSNAQVVHWVVLRDESQGNLGLFRCRLSLLNGDLLEMLERFRIEGGNLQVIKYRFHWQDGSGRLLKRWDNAAHHPEIPTHPHHVHEGSDENVLPHSPISAEEVLALLEPE